MATTPQICFLASPAKEAQKAYKQLTALYPHQPAIEKADILVVLGGDGFMLSILRDFILNADPIKHKPIYGMNRGTVGFLLNQYKKEALYQRLEQAKSHILHPLCMKATNFTGKAFIAHAINEVSLFRQTSQSADIDIIIDDVLRLEHLSCDGVLVASPAGSTAYNLSAHGPILPLGSNLLALTPISPFRPRRWRGALLPNHAHIGFKVNNSQKRPVSAVADSIEFRDIEHVEIYEDRKLSIKLLYDPEHNLEERVIREQFQG